MRKFEIKANIETVVAKIKAEVVEIAAKNCPSTRFPRTAVISKEASVQIM